MMMGYISASIVLYNVEDNPEIRPPRIHSPGHMAFYLIDDLGVFILHTIRIFNTASAATRGDNQKTGRALGKTEGSPHCKPARM